MARLVTAGAETKDATAEGLAVVTASTSTAHARTGTSSFSAANRWAIAGALGTTYYFRSYVLLDAGVGADTSILRIGNSTLGTVYVDVALTSSNTLILRAKGTTTVGSASAAIPVDASAWTRVELAATFQTGTIDYCELLVNGVSVASTTTADLFDSAPAAVGITGSAGHFWHDDIALNDSTGASQNSWPGDGKVVLLVPTSDNSAGSWKAGSAASAVSNGALFNAVDNAPPVGTASPNAATAAISNTVSGATTPNYDANMTTYTAAGIASGDTVNLVQQIIAHGEDIATGTKTGTFAMVSNPAIAASASVNFGADAGAAGTYPTTWTVTQGAVSYAPSVTVGTAPVARITKTDTGTRAADCCFMGLLVDYTPAPPVIPDLVMAPHRAP